MTNDDGLLAVVEAAIDAGAALLREGRWHSGSKVAKGDRDYATEVDIRIEETIRAALETAAPGIGFLGEEEGERVAESGALWVLDPIDGTVNFANGSPLCGISLALVEDGTPTLGRDRPAVAGGALSGARRIRRIPQWATHPRDRERWPA